MEGLSSAQDVSYDIAAYTPIGLYSYQWQLGHARFLLFDSGGILFPHRVGHRRAGLVASRHGRGSPRLGPPAYRQAL